MAQVGENDETWRTLENGAKMAKLGETLGNAISPSFAKFRHFPLSFSKFRHFRQVLHNLGFLKPRLVGPLTASPLSYKISFYPLKLNGIAVIVRAHVLRP